MQSTVANKVTISVILPVYNVEPWIGDCISSLKRQKQEGLEFIFVDDCSTDGSLAIIEEFAKEDSRVRILRNNENVGPGFSRNAGIEIAHGDYLSFIDPDDMVSDNFYELLYAKAKETSCDIIKGTRAKFNDGDPIDISEPNINIGVNRRINMRTKTKEPLFLTFTYEHQTAIFKGTLFLDKTVRYGVSYNAEDSVFLLKICHCTESIVTIDKAVYYYRKRTGAATSDYTMNLSWNEMTSMEEMLEYLYDKPRDENHIAYLANRMRGCFSNYYYAVRSECVTETEREEYLSRFREVAGYFRLDGFLCMKYPELQIFKEYGFVIPYSRKRGDVIFEDGIVRWTDFFLTHAGPRENWQYHGYTDAFVRANNLYLRAIRSGNESYRSGDIKRQLTRLQYTDWIIVMSRLMLARASKKTKRIGSQLRRTVQKQSDDK